MKFISGRIEYFFLSILGLQYFNEYKTSESYSTILCS